MKHPVPTSPGDPPVRPRTAPEPDRPLAVEDSPRNRVAAGIRRISGLVVGRPLDKESLTAAAAAIAKVAEDLERAAGPGKAPRGMPDHRGHPQDFFPTSPIIGYANPIAPPVDVWRVAGRDGKVELRGRACFGYPYEGPPTCVHGGVIAELFDELLGSVNIAAGRAGMTGTLTVRYRRPTPLLAELDLVARQERTEGRKLFASGAIYFDGEPTAEAEGVFIEARPERMIQLLSAGRARAGDAVVDPELADLVERGGRIAGAEGPPPR